MSFLYNPRAGKYQSKTEPEVKDIRGDRFLVTVRDVLVDGVKVRADIEKAANLVVDGYVANNGQRTPMKAVEVVVQDEVGQANGNHHLQMAIRFASEKSLLAVKNFIEHVFNPNSVYVAKFYAANHPAFHLYVLKDETFEPDGKRMVFGVDDNEEITSREITADEVAQERTSINERARDQGDRGRKRTMDEMLLGIMEGKMDLAQAQAHNPMVFCTRNKEMEKAYAIFIEKIPVKPTKKVVFCLYGKTGTGKTSAINAFKELTGMGTKDVFWAKIQNGKLWMDGYDRHPVIIFDDFESDMEPSDFLQMTDFNASEARYDIKYGKVRLFPKIFIFTSNSNPDTWYDGLNMGKREAIVRRLTFKQCFREFKDSKVVAQQMVNHVWNTNEDTAKELQFPPAITHEARVLADVIAPRPVPSPVNADPPVIILDHTRDVGTQTDKEDFRTSAALAMREPATEPAKPKQEKFSMEDWDGLAPIDFTDISKHAEHEYWWHHTADAAYTKMFSKLGDSMEVYKKIYTERDPVFLVPEDRREHVNEAVDEWAELIRKRAIIMTQSKELKKQEAAIPTIAYQRMAMAAKNAICSLSKELISMHLFILDIDAVREAQAARDADYDEDEDEDDTNSDSDSIDYGLPMKMSATTDNIASRYEQDDEEEADEEEPVYKTPPRKLPGGWLSRPDAPKKTSTSQPTVPSLNTPPLWK